MEITPDEMMVVCMARQVHDGELVAQGIATPLVAAAYLLARQTHAPHLYFSSAIGQSLCRFPAPLSLSHVEHLWLDRSMTNVGFARAVAEVLPSLHPLEFFHPAQIDPYGNFNNIAIGKDYHHPRLRLPGTGGIPDVTIYLNDIMLYIPRHSRVTFVAQLDFCAGLGHNSARKHGKGPRYLVSDLGEFDFIYGRMRITSYHPGVTVEKIQAHSGFAIEISPEIKETPLPTDTELHLLRNEIDPLNIRKLETLSGPGRRELLHKIIEAEKKNFHSSG
ncbi:MAG TPA: CoA-transferase [Anaerolineales bacterium]|nr:CoA-transferase [Anaerolineales bacterium]